MTDQDTKGCAGIVVSTLFSLVCLAMFVLGVVLGAKK